MSRNIKFVQATIILLGIVLNPVTGRAQWATNDYTINTFDSSTETNTWNAAWGAATGDIFFDANHDAQGQVSSGSLKLTANFDAGLNVGNNQFAFGDALPLGPGLVLDASIYTNLEFDVLWDTTNSPSNGGTNFGPLEILLNTSVAGVYIVPTNSGWRHVVLPIDPALPQVGMVTTVGFKMWAPSFTGTTTFWLDNIKLQALTNALPRPRPVLSFKPAIPGLQLVSSTYTGSGSRDNFFTANPGYSWVDAPTPTTYSVTIKTYPSFDAHPYYQTHIFLIPASNLGMPANDNPDWNAANLVFLSIQSLTNGNGVALLMFKTNAFNGGWDNQIWGRNVIGRLLSSNLLGKWTLTFSDNTNVTLTSPGLETTNFVLPAAAIPWFQDATGMYAYFGTQPNRDINAGQTAILSEVKITGGVDGNLFSWPDIDETFANDYLDPGTWTVSGYRHLPVATADTPFWLEWTLPDGGSRPMAEEQLDPNGWYNAPYAPVQPGSMIQTLVPMSYFGSDSSFFRLSR